jgi:starch phosphorylase
MFKNKEEFKKIFTERIIEKFARSVEESHISEQFDILGTMVRDYASINRKATKDAFANEDGRQLLYFSMEFLIGRLLVNNLQNLCIYQVVKEGLKDLNIDIHQLEALESDAGLGNGGLGRLAACFMDSIASLNYVGHGQSIRYEYGFFKQKIENGEQVEVPDQWLTLGNVWEIRKPKHAVEVKYYGHVESYQVNNRTLFRQVNTVNVKAVPYDMPIIGYKNKVTNNLRLWSAEPSESTLPKNQDFSSYLVELKQLCHGLYPDDSTEHGKMLRLRQQYFLVSAGLQSAINAHLRKYDTLDNFHEKHVIQLNDTHPVMCIPELMRILMDEHMYTWEKAWEITSKTMAYTNHTVMAEALEKWPVHYFQNLLPRIYMIIEEIHRRFTLFVRENTGNEDLVRETAIIRDGMVYMTYLAVVGSFSVNGVASLHTEILKKQTLKQFYYLFPSKFNNKTNGITHRRWLVYSNPELTDLINSKIGDEWILEPEKLESLLEFIDDEKLQNEFLKVKHQRKEILAKYIFDATKIEVDTNSIFDIQVKRLHAYKRQLLNVFHIIYLYQRLKEDSTFKIHPRTFIFGAKAAPSYAFAKNVIKLILAVANKVNNDHHVSKFMKVVFIENYDVSKAEIIMPACDVSEQISTAGKEASGTGNMKFMLNGAITLGTYDGANIEISSLVGPDNCVIFGLRENEVTNIKQSGRYNVWDIYQNDIRLHKVINSLIDGTFSSNKDDFKTVYDELMYRNDEYLILADFNSYVEAQEKITLMYVDKSSWARKCLVNIAKAGYFSSDRTIEEYVRDIWSLNKIRVIK